MSRASNTLKQALCCGSMLLVLALWLGFNQASTAMKFGVTVALIVIAVGLLAWRREKDTQTEADSACIVPDCRPKHIGSPSAGGGDAAASLFIMKRAAAGRGSGQNLHVAG